MQVSSKDASEVPGLSSASWSGAYWVLRSRVGGLNHSWKAGGWAFGVDPYGCQDCLGSSQ